MYLMHVNTLQVHKALKDGLPPIYESLKQFKLRIFHHAGAQGAQGRAVADPVHRRDKGGVREQGAGPDSDR